MPELPEVETVRRTLLNQILNKKITSVNVLYDKMLENTDKDNFVKTLISKTFKDIKRYGKYLIFIFEDCSVISHLRMEGKFFIKNTSEEISKHEHIVFTLDDAVSFRYHDTRKFGKMALLNTTEINEIMKYSPLLKLAKEANDESYSSIELYEKIKDKNIPVKAALLDQTIICGLGNIYVDEVCFLANLHPSTSCKKLTIDDALNILEASKVVLKKAIEAGGTTIRSYTSSLGVTGRFQLELLVHSKEKQPCPTCNTLITKIRVAGRGTYICNNCQRIRGAKVIGVTGTIASGKTTVTNYLIEKGYEVVDADEIVRNIKAKNKSGYITLVNEFGRKILNSNNEIDDKLLASIIFENEENRTKVNSLLHPIVKKTIINRIKNTKNEIIFISVPLLFEASFDDLCDEIIVLKTDEEVLIDRLMKRNNITYEMAKIRINSQMSTDEKCQKATYIIDNSFELCYTIKQTNEILERIGGE